MIALQETKCAALNSKHKMGDIITFDSQHHRYGLGFATSSNIKDRIIHTTSISERIAVLKLDIGNLSNRHNIATFINIYAPTSQMTQLHPKETSQFYKDLQQIYERNKNSGLVFILGDFNAHVGIPIDSHTTHMGKHINGQRNSNGESLIQFVKYNNLYINNTHFQHSARHITTWNGRTTEDRPLHTQIDYILSPHRQRFLFGDCRAFNGAQVNSDHSLLVGHLFLDKRYAMRFESRISETTEGRWRRQTLINDPAQQKAWHDSVMTKITQYTNNTKSDQLKWEHITTIYQTALKQERQQQLQSRHSHRH
jgi:exonuclease III